MARLARLALPWGMLWLAGSACQEPSAPVPRVETGARVSAGESAPGPVVLDETPPSPAFPPPIRSVRLRRSIAVKLEPKGDAKNIGTVAADTRVGFRGASSGPGCDERWIEIEPRGWVCERHLEASEREPRGVELPKLDRGSIVPGRFGKVIGEAPVVYTLADKPAGAPLSAGDLRVKRKLVGSVTVREQGTRTLGGIVYWHIGGGEWVRESSVRVHQPARHVGERLADDTGLTLPMTFAIQRKNPVQQVAVYDGPKEGRQTGKVLPREPVTVSSRAVDAAGVVTHLEVGEGEWIRAADTVTVELAAPPPGTLPGERWFDVDLDAQTLVAYEGELPVYVTFVSTGRRSNPTETGIFRIWIKFAETTMNGQMADEPAYSMATVPWTQFYAKDLALHTAYWHDHFGIRKSHGCVNLSPRDARRLYFWSDPQVPEGWSMAHGVREQPGSMVRVRSSEDPEPEFKGYAKVVYEDRVAQASRQP